MARTLIQEFTIPEEQAIAFTVRKGQVLRLTEVDGPQMADVAIFNAHHYKETYDPGLSFVLNAMEGIGNLKKITKLYSRPPRANVMFTVIEDKVGVHWIINGMRCNAKTWEFRGMPGHRNCHDNLAETLKPYGFASEDVPDVFNAFMNVEYGENLESYILKTPVAKKGDYIDLLAEMDCLVAISACPAQIILDSNKPLQVEIWE